MSDAPDDAGPTGVTFTLDGREITADPGELVIAAAERHGVYIPRFCWHPRMSPVGMCRMCICEVDTGRGPALQPTCMIEVSDGMNVDTASPTTKKAQDGILEFLLINHPLDCPVCDKGGECPLQDQTLAFGPGETRFVEEKRHFRKPIPISDLVLLDRERCILCDRCTRFASEVAGDPLISFVERGNETQVLTFPDEPFNSYFSGNTVQLCPVGALTARPYRFRARPWDLDQVESTCTTCAVGCRVTIESTRNEVTRYLGVDVDAVNHGWLCDRGRFDYEAIMSDDRLTVPLRRDPDDADLLVETSWHDALAAAAAGLRGAGSGGAVAVLGGARLTNEDASAWARLAAEALDTPHVDCQLDDGLPADLLRSLPMATIDEACASTLLWLGADPKEELPVLYLRLRGAVEAGTLTLIEAGPLATSLTPLAKRSERVRPGELPAAVTGLLDDLGDGPLVVAVGRASLADSVDPLAEAIGVVRGRRPDATFLPLLRRGNVRGAIDAGLTPGEGGLDCRGVLELAAAGGVGALVLLGADPLNDVPDRDLVRRAMDRIGFVVSIDTLPSDSTLRADVVLPAAAYAERSGTTTNLEGRVTGLGQKVTPPGTARPDWMIAVELAHALGTDLGVDSLDDLRPPGLVEALAASPEGIVSPPDAADWTAPDPVATPPVDSYSFSLVVDRELYDEAVGVRWSPGMAGLARGGRVRLNPTDADRLGVAAGVPVSVRSGRARVTAPVDVDARVPRGVAAIPFHQPDVDAGVLLDGDDRVTVVQIETTRSESTGGGDG